MRTPFSSSSAPYLSDGDAGDLENKAAVACCALAIATLVPVALTQLGVINRLPDPPGSLFDSVQIVKSDAAYPLGIPDGLLGIASYAATLTLLLTANPERPVLQRLLRAKLAVDAGMAAKNVRKQVTKMGKICTWCMGTAVATAGVVYFARKARPAVRPQAA